MTFVGNFVQKNHMQIMWSLIKWYGNTNGW